MSTTVLKARSQTLSRKYEIVWEMPNFVEAFGVLETRRSPGKSIIESVFDATHSPSKLPIRWSIKLTSNNSGNTPYVRFVTKWEFQNPVDEHVASDEICAQMQVFVPTENGGVHAHIIYPQKFVLMHQEIKTMDMDRSSIVRSLLPNANGQLTLQIKFEQFELPRFQNMSEMENLRREGVSKCIEDFSNLLASGHHSDFLVKLEGGVSFKVHKAILAARSSVLGRMLESGMEECSKGEMIINDMSSTTVNIVLQFLYTGSIDENVVTAENVEELAYAADKYDLPLIKEAVDRLLLNFCVVDNATKLWKTSKLFGLKAAEDRIGLFVQQNILEILKTGLSFEDKEQTESEAQI